MPFIAIVPENDFDSHSKITAVVRRDSERTQPIGLPRRRGLVPVPPPRLNVLIVEDDPAGARMCAAALRHDGWRVYLAGNAEEALACLQRIRPQIILLDLILPRMSGLLLAQIITVDPAMRGIAVVAMTALNNPEASRLALEAGCAACFYKPVDAATLSPALKSYVNDTSK